MIAYTEAVDGNPDAKSMRYEMGGDLVSNLGLAKVLASISETRLKKLLKKGDEE